MDLEFDAGYEEFRMQVRDFVANHRPTRNWRLGDGKGEERIAWLSLQIEQGYWARTIPKEYGGYGAEPDLLETVIMDEEFNKAGVIRGMMAQGPSMLEQNLRFWFKRIGNARHLLGGPEYLRNRAAELQGFAVAS